MTEQIPPNADLTAPRKKPSRGWYLLSLVLLVGSIAVFVSALRHKAAYLNDQIIPMPRFVAPTGDDAVVITVAKPGKQNIYYENLGELDGKAFNTPRRQVWTTYQSPSMTCKVWYIETGDEIEVRLPGVNDQDKPSRTSEDQIVTYDLAGRQGHSAWVFDADRAGDYRIEIEYVDAVLLEPGSVEVPPELTKAQKKQMLSADGAAYETDRREAIERAALASLEPVDVLFAVGPDPGSDTYFAVIGLKGAAAVLAFGFTFSVLIALLTLMLRSGSVTPRGELSKVQRGLTPGDSNTDN